MLATVFWPSVYQVIPNMGLGSYTGDFIFPVGQLYPLSSGLLYESWCLHGLVNVFYLCINWYKKLLGNNFLKTF